MHSRPLTTHNHHYNGTTASMSQSSSSPGSPNSQGAAAGSAPVAFAEFKDAECASSAMSTLQGTYLLSSDRGPIRIEYAKSRMAIIGDAQGYVGVGGGGGAFREVI